MIAHLTPLGEGKGDVPRITLSGWNDEFDTRTVYADDVEVGRVIPSIYGGHETWEALGLDGRSHGCFWGSDWWAAEALVRGMGLR